MRVPARGRAGAKACVSRAFCYPHVVRIRFCVALLAAVVGGLAACAAIANLDSVDAVDRGPTADASGGDGAMTQRTIEADGSATFDAAGPAISEAGVAPEDASEDSGTVATFLCPTGGTVTDCSACAGNPLQCVLCGGSGPRKFCTTGRVCNASQTLSNWCPCSGTNPAACPFARQTCYGGICLTCGEQNSTNQYKCNNGMTCSANSYVCQ